MTGLSLSGAGVAWGVELINDHHDGWGGLSLIVAAANLLLGLSVGIPLACISDATEVHFE